MAPAARCCHRMERLAFLATGKNGRSDIWLRRVDSFFVSDDRKFYAVDYSIAANSGAFECGVPRFLFDMRANVFNSRNSYIPSRDGTRFLVNMLLEADDAPINVVHNWRAVMQ